MGRGNCLNKNLEAKFGSRYQPSGGDVWTPNDQEVLVLELRWIDLN